MASEFQRRVEDDHSWFIFAEISFRAAGVLWNISDEGRRVFADVFSTGQPIEEAGNAGIALQMSIPSLLLSGFAFESLLKAIRLRQLRYRGEPITVVKNG